MCGARSKCSWEDPNMRGRIQMCEGRAVSAQVGASCPRSYRACTLSVARYTAMLHFCNAHTMAADADGELVLDYANAPDEMLNIFILTHRLFKTCFQRLGTILDFRQRAVYALTCNGCFMVVALSRPPKNSHVSSYKLSSNKRILSCEVEAATSSSRFVHPSRCTLSCTSTVSCTFQ